MESTTYYTTAGQGDPFSGLIGLVIAVVALAGLWKMFEKAGKPGWAAIVPIYNLWVLLEVVGRPVWWIVLLLVPLVNIVIAIVLTFDTAKAYGKGMGWGFLLLFLPFIGYPILGFSNDVKYVGGANAAPTQPPAAV